MTKLCWFQREDGSHFAILGDVTAEIAGDENSFGLRELDLGWTHLGGLYPGPSMLVQAEARITLFATELLLALGEL